MILATVDGIGEHEAINDPGIYSLSALTGGVFMTRLSCRAFTLLEAMIVIAIIGSTFIALPALLQWMNQQGISHAADQLRCDLQLARMMAISHRKACAIQFNVPGKNQYQNSLTQKVVDLGAYKGGVHFLPEGPDRNAMSGQIIFNSRGMAVPAGDIYLANTKESRIYRLLILMPGGISQFRWNGEQWN
jgi:prepilin-type N-terminal cleavage/methylation domain-containing protein